MKHSAHEKNGKCLTRQAVPVVAVVALLTANATSDAGERSVESWFVVSRSRGAAGTQESVTYRPVPFAHRWLWTASLHYDANWTFLHTINSVASHPETGGWVDSWRGWAGHLASEFWYGHVIGSHWARDPYGNAYPLAYTVGHDCNALMPAPE